jgi:hypothetical protein
MYCITFCAEFKIILSYSQLYQEILILKKTVDSKRIQNISNWGLGVVAHACEHTCVEGRDRRIVVQDQPGQIVTETLSQQASWAWWYIFVISAITGETQTGELRSKASPG